MDGTRDEAARDDLMPYGVDTIRLRISFPAAPASRGYNGRAWGMRPLRGWTGGAQWDEEAAAAAAQASASSSLRATLDRVIAAVEARAVKAQGGVQLAQAEPPPENETTRRAEPNSEELSLPEVGRVGRYSNLRSQLQEIDPDTPLLQTLADPKSFVPTEADIDALELALARARAQPPASQRPVDTFADPGGPVGDNAVQNRPDANHRGAPLLVNPSEPAATRESVPRSEDLNAKPTTSAQSRGSASQNRADIDNAIQSALKSSDGGVLYEGVAAQGLRNAGINITKFQRYVYDPQTNRIITDIDIETDRAIIELQYPELAKRVE